MVVGEYVPYLRLTALLPKEIWACETAWVVQGMSASTSPHSVQPIIYSSLCIAALESTIL